MKKERINPFFYFNYYFNYLKKNYFSHGIMYLIGGFAIAVLVASSFMTEAYHQQQLNHLNALVNQEIFVTSETE